MVTLPKKKHSSIALRIDAWPLRLLTIILPAEEIYEFTDQTLIGIHINLITMKE
jgi:hypothetical protein